jgi:hypothetical protein
MSDGELPHPRFGRDRGARHCTRGRWAAGLSEAEQARIAAVIARDEELRSELEVLLRALGPRLRKIFLPAFAARLMERSGRPAAAIMPALRDTIRSLRADHGGTHGHVRRLGDGDK